MRFSTCQQNHSLRAKLCHHLKLISFSQSIASPFSFPMRFLTSKRNRSLRTKLCQHLKLISFSQSFASPFNFPMRFFTSQQNRSLRAKLPSSETHIRLLVIRFAVKFPNALPDKQIKPKLKFFSHLISF